MQCTALVSDISVLFVGMLMLSFVVVRVIVGVLMMLVRRRRLCIGLSIRKPGHNACKLRKQEKPHKPGNYPLHRAKECHSAPSLTHCVPS